MVSAGVLHLHAPTGFVRIMPDYLPWHLQLVYLSGLFEILGGVGLLIPRLIRHASLGLIVLYIAVFPANVHMAIHHIPFGESPIPTFLLWLRLPLQLIPIGLCLWFARQNRSTYVSS